MLLYNIDEETMIEVISKSKIMLYKPNEIIFYQNATPLYLYLILNGEVSFKKYSNSDLLTMIGSESNIVLSRRYTDNKCRNSKITRQTLQSMRNSAVKNYQVKITKKSLKCGDFFGEENLVTKALYNTCAVVEKDTYALFINLNVFNYYLKKNVTKTYENIKDLVMNRMPYFKQIEHNLYKIYMDTVVKLYPKSGDIICKENELSNKLYLIYQGKFAVQKNSKNLGNIIFLNKGDLFGYESLIDIKPNFEKNFEVEISLKKNEYTIINKDNRSIILCFDIPFFDELTTWKLSKNLLNYFKEQINIIRNFENIKKISSRIFEEKYSNLSKQKKSNKSLNIFANEKTCSKDKKYKLLFKKTFNSKKIFVNNKISNKRKVNFLQNYAKVLPKNYLLNILKENEKEKKLNSIKSKSTSTHKKIKPNKFKLFFNNSSIENKDSIDTNNINKDIEMYITPRKEEENIVNNINMYQTYDKFDKKSVNNISTSLSNINGINSNSTQTTQRKRETSSSNKISSFESIISNYKRKSRNKAQSTLFQNFISNNNRYSKAKNKKIKKIKNKIYFRNDNICSKFNVSKRIIYDKNPINFFSKFIHKKIGLTKYKGKSEDKDTYKYSKNMVISKYNFPLICDDENDNYDCDMF